MRSRSPRSAWQMIRLLARRAGGKGDQVGRKHYPRGAERRRHLGRGYAVAALAAVAAASLFGSALPGASALAHRGQAAASSRLYVGTTSGKFGRHPITLRIAGRQVVGLTVYTDGSDPSTCGFDDLGPLPQRMSISHDAFAGTRRGISRETESVSGQLHRGSVSVRIVADHGSFSGQRCQIVHDAVLRPWSPPSGALTTPRAGGRYRGWSDQGYPVSFAVSKDARSILRMRADMTMLCGGRQYGIEIPGQNSIPWLIASRISVGKAGGLAASVRYSGQTAVSAPAAFDGTLTIRITGQFVGRSRAAVGRLRAVFAPSRSARSNGAQPCATPVVAFWTR